MAEGASAADDLASRFIDVKVLSQLAHPHGTIHFHSILAGTCVRELKERVQDIIPGRPPIENLRFIHQGRVVARDSDSLVDVFGRDAVQQALTHTLHLVIREQHGSGNVQGLGQDGISRVNVPTFNALGAQVPAAAAQQPLGVRPVQNGLSPHFQALQSNGTQMQHLHNTGSLHPNAPGVLHQTPFGMAASPSPSHLHPPQFQQHPSLTGQMPAIQGLPDLNSIIQQQMQQAIAASQAAVRAEHELSSWTQLARDPARQDGTPHATSEDAAHNEGQYSQRTTNAEATEEMQRLDTANASDAANRNDGPPRRNVHPESITRHGLGPNGERWTMTTSTSTSHFPRQPGLTALTQPHVAPQLQRLPEGMFGHPNPINTVHFRAGANPNHFAQVVPYFGWLGPAHAIAYMQTLHGQFESAMQACRQQYSSESDPGRSTAGYHDVMVMLAYISNRNRAQQVVNSILTHGPPSGYASPTAQQVATLQLLNEQFQRAVRDWTSDFTRSRSERIDRRSQDNMSPLTSAVSPSEPTAATAPRSGVGPTNLAPRRENSESQASPNPVTAYLLNSPAGPQAILYTEQGVFSSRPQLHPRVVSHASAQAGTLGEAEQLARAGREQQLALVNQGQGIHLNQPFVQQLQDIQQQRQGPNAIALNLTPFFQALWLFIRGYAFMWLFLGGRGTGSGIFSWRSAVLVALSFAYWAVQAGIGAHQLEMIRRYWNELVGPNPAARPAQQERGAREDRAPGDVPTDARATEPQTGDRNSSQHGRDAQGDNGVGNELAPGQGGPLRESLRLFERTIALFLASLYPGVGERHVAERDQARREAEERDRARAAAAAAQEMQTRESLQSQGEGQSASLPGQVAEPSSDSARSQT